MSDIKLFKLDKDGVQELEGKSMGLEKSLQSLMEAHLEAFLGVRFLATEYSTGKTHGGRIDSLGLDENHCPVIIEYKRSLNENVINQGLFYFDWLMDHKAEFKWLVMEKLGKQEAEEVEWSSPRLICIAGDFTRYDEHAVQQINRNIELMRYREYNGEFLLLDLVNSVQATVSADTEPQPKKGQKLNAKYKTFTDFLEAADEELTGIFEALEDFLISLGDDVQAKTLKFYRAFKRIKNFACVEVHPQTRTVLAYTKVNPDKVDFALYPEGFLRDVRTIGHFGTGDLEIRIKSRKDLEHAKDLLVKSYEAS